MITDLKQVDQAVIDKIKGLQVQDSTGLMKDVPVLYINPEGEFKPESYPSIIVYRSGAYPDFTRWSNDSYVVEETYAEDGSLRSISEIDNPEPYLVYYSIRLYYTYNGDGVVMNNHLMKTFKRGAYLPIEGDKYDVSMVSYKNPNATYREFGVIKENQEREFTDQYLYKAEINLYDGVVKDTKVLLPPEQGGGIVITTHLKDDKEGQVHD